jgi:hypothetical protein
VSAEARAAYEAELDRLMLSDTRSSLFTALLQLYDRVAVGEMAEPDSTVDMRAVVKLCRKKESSVSAAQEAAGALASNLLDGRSRLHSDRDASAAAASDPCTLSRDMVSDAKRAIDESRRASSRFLASQLELAGAAIEMVKLAARGEQIVKDAVKVDKMEIIGNLF